MSNDFKTCPFCAEEIPETSIICPNCGEKVSQEPIDTKTIKVFFGALVGIIILFVLGYFIIAYVDFSDIAKKFQKPDRFLKKGITLYNKEKYDEALEFFEKQIVEDNNAMAYFYEGKVYEKQNKLSQAIRQYKKALKYKSNFDELKVPLVKLCLKDEDMSCVNEYIESAYKQDKKDIQLVFYYASSILKETEKSVPLLKEVAEKEPDNYLANKYIGNYYYNEGEYKTALPYLKNSYNSRDKFKHNTGVENLYKDLEDEGLLMAGAYILNDEYTNAIAILDQIIKKTGDADAKKLKEIAVQRKNYYIYQKEKEKSDAAYRKEQEAYNKSREEYYREQQKSEPDFGPYMRELQRRIKNNWEPPKGNESKSVVLLFKIAKDGRLLSCRVHKSSGLPSVDQAALKAVELTAPFSPLPADFKGQNIDIQFTFDYRVFGATY